LDGIAADDISEALRDGTMPTLAAAAQRGGFRAMRSSLPPVSSVAWSSFMTACNPGRHGIFGFTHPRREDYRLAFPASTDLRTPTLWDRAADDGLRSIVINLPATYPAQRINGSLIAGFVAPTLERACYPPDLARRLASLGYAIDVDVALAQVNRREFYRNVLDVAERRIDVMKLLLSEQQWSLAILTFTEADRLQHVAYHATRHGGDAAETLRDWLRRTDAFVAWVLERFPDAGVMALSDHGFGALRRYLNIDAWLASHGWLNRENQRMSRAFSMDPGRIYINASTMFDGGCVAPADVRALAAEIAAGLTELLDPDTGEPAIEAVIPRRDAYSGGQARSGPHLVALPRPGYELKSSGRLPLFSDVSDFEGTHTYEDAFFISDRPLRDGDARIEDAGASVLQLLDLHAGDVDGRSLIA
jgi:predicted AlkP superfamily phosphohydrolase/phosphomutase